MDQNKPTDLLTNHDYDGIKEYDNKLPNWWLNIFYVCILFSVGYMYYYHSGKYVGTQAEEFDKEEKIRVASEPMPSKGLPFSEEQLSAAFRNHEKLEVGKAVFAGRCVACHGKDGGGGIGPNLTDEYWLHGGKLAQIATTITNGVPEKGMIAWGAILTNDEIISVAAFVKTLKGTHPDNPKAPQGDKESL